MSISQNYPLTSPSLSLDFSNTKTLDPRITFSRPTEAVYYDGKSVTKAEENLWVYSQAFTNPVYATRAGTTTVTSTAPDGTSTSGLYIENTASSFHGIDSANGTFAGVLTNTIYTYSIFLAPYSGTRNIYIGVGPSGGGNAVGIILDSSLAFLTTLSQGSAYTYLGHTITPSANGFSRVSFSFLNGSPTTAYMFMYLAPSGVITYPLSVYTGDGTSGFYLWGAQLEQR